MFREMTKGQRVVAALLLDALAVILAVLLVRVTLPGALETLATWENILHPADDVWIGPSGHAYDLDAGTPEDRDVVTNVWPRKIDTDY